MAATARLFDLQRFSLHDGPGIRTTVFFKGCGLRCLWCHNPESQRPEPETMAHKGGVERVGAERDVDAVVATILRDKPFYDASGGGATLSGGEPLLQPEAALAILRGCRAGGVRTAVETAGDVPWAAIEAVRPFVDLFLFDLKGIDPVRHRANTGADNARLLANARRLAVAAPGGVRFRMPVVPGFNDGEADAVAAFARSCGAPLELLAYHRIGTGKYAALGRPCPTAGVEPPSRAAMRALAARLGALFEEPGI